MMNRLHRVLALFLGTHYPDRIRIRQIGANCPLRVAVTIHAVRAEDLEGIVMLIVNNPLDVVWIHRGGRHKTPDLATMP
jgi:hypothetical protein